MDTGTAGTVYWDGFEARRGSHIGPLSFGPASKGLAASLRVSLAASFVYDGDGKRVAQTINGVTTYFVGNYYEKQGSTITKYYFAGSQRVAMREGNALYYLLSDHLGSTSLTTDSNGNIVSEMRYSAWGGVRYSSGSTPSEHTFTGQYGYDFGLMFFNARWLDVSISHFVQADTMIPGAGQSQAWDRFAYVFNSPLKYTDPTGHDPWWNDPYYDLDNLVDAGIWQQSGGICHCNQRPRNIVHMFLDIQGADALNTGIGPAKVTDNQMEADFGKPASGDSQRPRGYGLGLREPGSSIPDQNNYDVAELAMGRRIAIRLQACLLVGCSATDRIIVAALGANESISAKDILTSFRNPDYLNSDGSFNWKTYIELHENPYNQSYIKNKLIPQFLEGISPHHRNPSVDWDYIEKLIK